VDLTGLESPVQAIEYFVVADGDVQISIQHTFFSLSPPRLPAHCEQGCASTANSMGSSWNTDLQKPLTICDRSRAGYPAAGIEELVVADARGARFMLHGAEGFFTST